MISNLRLATHRYSSWVAIVSPFALWYGGVTRGHLCVILVASLMGSPQADAETVIRIEETEITLVGSWETEVGYGYSGDSAVLVNFDVLEPQAYATFEFEGTGITWVGARTHNAGLFDWIIDEGTPAERRGTVNTYVQGVERVTTEVLVTDLSAGMHRFKFLSLGIHGGTMTSGTPSETYIDAFDVVTSTKTDVVTILPVVLPLLLGEDEKK